MNQMKHIPDSTVVYYEDIVLDDWHSLGEYKVDRQEVVEFAQQWDPQPFHIDEASAKLSIFGGLTGSSIHILAVLSRLSHRNPERVNVMANLTTEFNMPNPMRVGDTLYFQTTAKEKRLSRSRPNAGIVTFQTVAINQAEEVILNHISTSMVSCRPS